MRIRSRWFAALSMCVGSCVAAAPDSKPIQGDSYSKLREAALAQASSKAILPQSSMTIGGQRGAAGAPLDNFGCSVSISGDYAAVGICGDVGQTGTRGAVYVYSRGPEGWLQEAKLVSPEPAQNNTFGLSVSVSGNAVVVGEPGSNSSRGAAHVFRKSSAGWQWEARLVAVPESQFAQFGYDVSMLDDSVLVGGFTNSPGAAHVFSRTNGQWQLEARLEATNAEGASGFGLAVVLAPGMALVGAPHANGSTPNSAVGAVYDFRRGANGWTQYAKLQPASAQSNSQFGRDLAKAGDTLFIGAPADNFRGSVYGYNLEFESWHERFKLAANDSTLNFSFGQSVSAFGTTALIGAPGADNQRGAAYGFSLANGVWTQRSRISAPPQVAPQEYFGTAVALDSADAFVGSFLHDSPFQAQGAVFVFGVGSDFSLRRQLDAGVGAQEDRLGYALATDGTYAAIGVPKDESGTVARTGSVQIFVKELGRWQQSAKLVASDGQSGDDFGTSVAISGDNLVVGAPFHAVSGAAYVYQRVGSEWIFRRKLVSNDRSGTDEFGATVALEQNRALISARGNSAVYVFVREQQSWAQEAKLFLTPIQFGNYSVAIDSSFVFAGNPEFGIGKVQVFRLDAGTWVEQAPLESPRGTRLDFFGHAMALSGNRLLVSEPLANSSDGVVYVFEKNGVEWIEAARLSPSRAGGGGRVGYSVALQGDVAVAGALLANDLNGAAHVFSKRPDGWTQSSMLTSPMGARGTFTEPDQFGWAVAAAPGLAIVSAPGYDGDPLYGNRNQGLVSFFELTPAFFADSFE